ncbi:MAG: arginine deiminase family protein [Acidobacteriota bacterium]|nr:arginine deiminase family protein [Acidobacteriota bacterium]
MRPVSPSLGECELTFVARAPIDVRRAEAQHAAYCQALAGTGARIVYLAAEPDLPDAVFVEDTAVSLDDLIVVTRPGSRARRDEIVTAASALAAHRPVSLIREPATLDGGDVLRVGRDLFVGLTARTNRDGFDQLAAIVSRAGMRATAVPVQGALHLKTAVTALDDGALIMREGCVDRGVFAAYDVIDADPGEPEGANVIRVNGRVFIAASAPRTRDLLATRGYDVIALDISEFEKAEAGLSCLSILI